MDTSGTEAPGLGGGAEGYNTPRRPLLGLANRHGPVAGATGTGKTVTRQILAEGVSDAGIPVVVADVKGDIAGLAMPGSATAPAHPGLVERSAQLGLALHYRARPAQLWDLFGEAGPPMRATVSEMGPLLLARLLDLSEAQEGVLAIAFRVADEQGLPLLDLADLQAILAWVRRNARDLSLRYGYVTAGSVGAIQRQLLVLEWQGGASFLDGPAFDLIDLQRTDAEGRRVITILAADRLIQSPRLFATVLLWLLSELFERLPEVGNPDKPRLVFVFDEAHLLFDDAPRALVDKVEQVARLIRSKGVGVIFVTQNPADIPDAVLEQLGNRVQHALRVFTPKDRKDLDRAAGTFRTNPASDTPEAITQVGSGESVTSLLDEKGRPGGWSGRWSARPRPGSGPSRRRSGPRSTPPPRSAPRYAARLDRDSARAMRARRMREETGEEPPASPADDGFARGRRYDPGAERKEPRSRGCEDAPWGEAIGGMVLKELRGATGRRIVRTILGTLLRGR